MHDFKTFLLLNWERMPFVVYSDKSAFNIVLQSELNNVKVNSEINAVFSFLKTFYSCSIHYYKISSVNFVKDTVISAKNLMNY